MENIIAVLPESVANQIAAGEVIQQPSSAIKELMENAIDAGATRIDVAVKDGGRTLIQVSDNGKGMSPSDAVLCFERHATSKLHKADDLFAISTMGFRGEALASIAAIAQVELITRRQEDSLGCKVCIAGSKLEGTEQVVAEAGTRFSVRNIFFNVPARRKFMGTASKQMQAIRSEFIQIALAHPECRFSLTDDGTSVFSLKEGNLRQRIVSLFGETLNKSLYPLDIETDVINIHGFVADPQAARKRTSEQFFFINRRFIKHPYFRKAIQNVYEPLVSEGMQPVYFLFLEAEAGTIDVNISPTKTEVKFEHEQIIWPILNAAVKECLGKFNAVPSIDFDQTDAPFIEVFHPNEDVKMPQVQYNPSYNPFKKTAFQEGHHEEFRDGCNYGQQDDSHEGSHEEFHEGFRDGFREEFREERDEYEKPDTGFIEENEALQGLFSEDGADTDFLDIHQLFGRYIAVSTGGSLLLIDQHRAETRIHFERYRQQLTLHRSASEALLFPEEMDLPPARKADFESIRSAIEDLGFGFDTSQDGKLSITALPAFAKGLNPCNVVSDLIDSYVEMNSGIQLQGAPLLQERNYRLALQLARRTAIPYGQILSVNEMREICKNLFRIDSHNLTPDGKHIILNLKCEELIKRFG